MVQPSYPHTLELKHSRPHSREEFNPDGSPVIPADPEVSTLAPSDRAPVESHANDDDSQQTEQPGTKPVNEDSIIRKEVKPGPGEPH